jgi:hypothetical protein
MRTFFKWLGIAALISVALSAALVTIGMMWDDLGHTVQLSVGGDTVAVANLSELPWPHALFAWLAIALAMLIVVTVVPMSLLFAFGVVAVVLAATAALLLLPAALFAAPFAFILWVVWFRKRKRAAGLPPPAPGAAAAQP